MTADLGGIIDKLALEYTAPWQFVLFRDRFIFPDAPKHYTAARMMALIELVLLAVAWRKARTRGDGFTEALCVVCAVSLLTAAFSLTRIRGVVAPHHTAWISIIGFASWVAIAAGCWVIDAPRWAAGPMPRFLFLIGVWFASCLLWPIRIIAAIHANPEVGVLTESVARVIRAAEPGRIRISWNRIPRHGEAPLDTFTWATAVMLQLEKNDLQFTTARNPDLRWMLGEPRWESTDSAGAELVFFIGTLPPPLERIECVERGENYFLRYPVCVGRLPAVR